MHGLSLAFFSLYFVGLNSQSRVFWAWSFNFEQDAYDILIQFGSHWCDLGVRSEVNLV
jgi:hypothetical protein